MQDDRAHSGGDRRGARGQARHRKLNVDENPQVTQKYNILNIPTLGVFSGGEVVRELVGTRSKPALLRELANLP